MSDRDKLIRDRAYAIWENEGQPHGRHDQHWQQASIEMGEASAAPAKSAARKASAPAKGPRGAKAKAAVSPPAKAAKPSKGRTSKSG